MHAMLPLTELAALERIIACPEAGQGCIGVTAPEAIAIADYIRKSKSPPEQKRIYESAVENAKIMASRTHSESVPTPHPCALKGEDNVCCVYGERPLRCRPLHAIAIARKAGAHSVQLAPSSPEALRQGHEETVAQGIELGVTRALTSAGLDAKIYELNSALATALAIPDADERWAKGESLFLNPIV